MPRDCTALPIRAPGMYSPLVMRYPILMTNKQNTQTNAKAAVDRVRSKISALENEVKQLREKNKKKTPFRDVGGTVGEAAGNLFNNGTMGRNIGKWLGSGIGWIFGSGDYQLANRGRASYNVLAGQIPKFSTTRATNVVCHREYLLDVVGTSGFGLTSFSLNPGLSATFPWLSTVANAYQEYRIHGMIFEFRSLATDYVNSGIPGVLMMGTEYNATAAPFTSKQQMENSEYAVSVKPTVNQMHMIECAPGDTTLKQRYVRSGALSANSDAKFYDWGTFQIATQGNSGITLGELWISYCVEFFKPQLNSDLTGTPLAGTLSRNTVTNAAPMGLVGLINAGDILISSISNTSFQFAAIGTQIYSVEYVWTGSAATYTPPVPSYTNATALSEWNGKAYNYVVTPNSGATSITSAGLTTMVQVSGTGPQTVTMTLSTAGISLPGSAYLDVKVILVDYSST